MAERRTAITNEPVGARLGRALRRNRSQEEQDILEAYRTQTPVDEIRRRREGGSRSRMGGESSGMAESAEAGSAAVENRTSAPTAQTAPANEVRATANTRNAQRNPPRSNARMSPRAAAPREMTADELNDLSLRRGAGGEGVEQTLAGLRMQQRLEEMGGSGDLGAASARARGEQIGPPGDYNMKKGGVVKKMAKGGVVKKMATGGASRRGDGCATRGKTKGRMV